MACCGLWLDYKGQSDDVCPAVLWRALIRVLPSRLLWLHELASRAKVLCDGGVGALEVLVAWHVVSGRSVGAADGGTLEGVG